MITVPRSGHKFRRPACLLLMLALMATGCTEAPSPARQQTGVARLDAEGLETWVALARTTSTDATPPLDSFNSLFALQAYRQAFAASPVKGISPATIRESLEAACGAPPQGTGSFASPRPNKVMEDNFRYLADRLDLVAALPDSLLSRGTLGTAYDAVVPYLQAEQRLDSLQVLLFAVTPSMYWIPPDVLVADAGLLLAAGPRAPQMISALLFRKLVPSARPFHRGIEDGREQLIASFHELHLSSVQYWIEDFPTMVFDTDHPRFAKPDPRRNRERAIAAAAEAVDRMGSMLTGLLVTRPELMQQAGDSIYDYLAMTGGYQTVGWAAAALIHDHAGEDGWLAAARGTPLTWLDAFQAAARSGESTGDLAHIQPWDETTVTILRDLLTSPSDKETP